MLRQFIAAICAALFLAFGLAGLAKAQPIILVVDEERAVLESTVGQHIAAEMTRIGQEIELELAPLANAVRTENEALTAETSAMTQEAIAQRPDLSARIDALERDALVYNQRAQIASQEIQATQRTAMQPVLAALGNILQEIVEERNADLLLNRSQVMYASEAVDITPAAIARLNEVMPTTPVNRVRAPQQATAPAQ